MTEIFLGVVFFTTIVLSLVIIILFAKSRLVSSGAISIIINNDTANPISANAGGKLLNVLSTQKIFLSPPVVVVEPADNVKPKF